MKKNETASLAGALGASRVIPIAERNAAGPLDWLALGDAIRGRLVSSGGRPSDPRWDTKRLVPFRRRTWQRLAQQARRLSRGGRKVGPAQLAAFLIEERLP